MPEQWIVRIQDKEYGPADLETLREWVREGRLIRENEMREAGAGAWIRAGDVPKLFPERIPSASTETPGRQQSFAELLSESWRVYRKGFPKFFFFALLVAVPWFLLQLTLPVFEIPQSTAASAGVIANVVLIFLLVGIWPISLAGLQLVAADAITGQADTLSNLLRRARKLWPRMAQLCLLVYASYFFWTGIPLLAVLSLTTGAASITSLLLALLILSFLAYMVARLFINFLFWQQAGALGEQIGAEALRQSKRLARQRLRAPRLQWPLYRGAILASLWLVLLLVASAGIELPFLLYRMRGITSLDQVVSLAQSLAEAKRPDALTIASSAIGSLLHAVLRPLLAASFVVLYFDAKARSQNQTDDN
jgi:GYF domain 2